jgi:hypothetical protein
VELDDEGFAVAGWLVPPGAFAGPRHPEEAWVHDPVHGLRSLRQMLAASGAEPVDWTFDVVAGLSSDGGTLVGNGAGPIGPLQGFVARLPVLADVDEDGVPNDRDLCALAPDPGQLDRGGIGTGSPPDGIGDACQCGDVTGDGRVTAADALAVRRALTSPPAAALARPALCDVGGSAGCTVADALVIARALLVPPAAVIEPRCPPASP